MEKYIMFTLGTEVLWGFVDVSPKNSSPGKDKSQKTVS